MSEYEIKLRCYELTGEITKAQQLYDFVTGKASAKPATKRGKK